MVKTVKFGGSSLASAMQFRKVKDIIQADPSRRYVIPSAPGKRNPDDTKVTDLFYACYKKIAAGADSDPVVSLIQSRYIEIIDGLGLDLDLGSEMSRIFSNLKNGYGRDYAASRGEYLNGLIMAAYLDFPFVDAAEVVLFDEKGNFLPEETNEALKRRLRSLNTAVIPGFYGSMPDGTVKTFSRGGSDITGSLVARAVEAQLYENFTDVSGFLLADPRIVDDPVSIGVITYKELHELARMGACVLHEDAIYPVKAAGIPINIRNTNSPEDFGTLITNNVGHQPNHEITGIAGKKGYCTLSVRKPGFESIADFENRVLTILQKEKIPCESIPTSPDSISILIPQNSYFRKEFDVLSQVHSAIHPDAIYLDSDLALVAIGGRGKYARDHIVSNVFSALAEAHIHIRTIDQGMKDLAMVIGVADRDFESTIQVIYNKFIQNEAFREVLPV